MGQNGGTIGTMSGATMSAEAYGLSSVAIAVSVAGAGIAATAFAKNSTGQGRGVGGKGWRGDRNWKQNVKKVEQGGNIEDLNGEIPTQQEAIDLINEAGGTVNRIEGPHNAPNPHNYPHINYTTSNGIKGTIRIR